MQSGRKIAFRRSTGKCLACTWFWLLAWFRRGTSSNSSGLLCPQKIRLPEDFVTNHRVWFYLLFHHIFSSYFFIVRHNLMLWRVTFCRLTWTVAHAAGFFGSASSAMEQPRRATKTREEAANRPIFLLQSKLIWQMEKKMKYRHLFSGRSMNGKAIDENRFNNSDSRYARKICRTKFLYFIFSMHIQNRMAV